jgi:poly(3-hydroxybutyrate) depolymerase
MGWWIGASDFAEDNNVIVVLPNSLDTSNITWDISSGSNDLVLFDDIRSCLSQELDIDLGRFYSTGFSFGGLWSTFLTMERSDVLAATMPMSGGLVPFFVIYNTPDEEVPVLLMWGGETDVYGVVDFEDGSLDFSEELIDDGHFVMLCDHGGGHSVPTGDIHDILANWLLVHEFGVASPYLTGDFSLFPSYCYIP